MTAISSFPPFFSKGKKIKTSSRFPLSAFSIALIKLSMDLNLKTLSLVAFVWKKRLHLKYKNKLISKRWGEGRNLGAAFPMAWVKPLFHVEFFTGALSRVCMTIHRLATRTPHIYSSNHPKNVCYVFIIKNNYGPTLSSSGLKSLGTARGKLSPIHMEQPVL